MNIKKNNVNLIVYKHAFRLKRISADSNNM
jgi:hypothetical protein